MRGEGVRVGRGARGLAALVLAAGALAAAGAAAAPVPQASSAPAALRATSPDSTLRAFDFLVGRWRIPRAALPAGRPDLAELVIIDASWAVGGKAIRYREYVTPAGEADLEGLIYWDPAEQRVELVAVAGSGDGQGRLFEGTFTALPDGRLEKVYDVRYRTPADVPGEELGGLHRRFREVLEPAGADGLVHTLEWWRDGRWQPFGQGRYELERAPG